MVKRRKLLQDGGVSSAAGTHYLAISGCSTFKEYRRKRLTHVKALKKMLTSRRSGPMSSEEIGDGTDSKEPGATGNRSVTPGAYKNGDGTTEFRMTARTGRRNALPDILGRYAEPGLIDLLDRFGELSTETDQPNDGRQDPNAPGTSKQQG